MIDEIEKEITELPAKLREPIDLAIKSYQIDFQASNETLSQICEMFKTKPAYSKHYDPTT